MVNDMDKMFVRVPVAIKSKSNRRSQVENYWRCPKHHKKRLIWISSTSNSKPKKLFSAASDLSVLPSLREQIEMERNKINAD